MRLNGFNSKKEAKDGEKGVGGLVKKRGFRRTEFATEWD